MRNEKYRFEDLYELQEFLLENPEIMGSSDDVLRPENGLVSFEIDCFGNEFILLVVL